MTSPMLSEDQLKMQQTWILTIFTKLGRCVNVMRLSDQTGSDTLAMILAHTAILASDTLTYADLAALDNEIMAWLEAKNADIKAKTEAA